MWTSVRRLPVPVAGRPGDQIMGCSSDRDVLVTSTGSRQSMFTNSTYKHIKLTLTGYYSKLYSEW